MGKLRQAAAPGDQAEKKSRLRFPIVVSGIKRRWLFNNVSVVVAMILLLLITVGVATTSYYYNSVRASLTSRTSTARQINQYMSASYDQFYSYAGQLVQDFSDRDKIEMQFVDTYGRIMFSSTGLTAGSIPSTSDVADCLSTQETSYFVGYDLLTEERVMAVTAPVFHNNGQMIGMVRYVTSLKLLDAQLRNVWLALAGFGVLLIGLIIISNQFFIRSIVNPVLKINELARKIAGGQYGARLDVEWSDEIGELCTTLNDMSAELARMEKLKNDFISSVSHELRTPLTAINGWAETVAGDLGDPELAASGLSIIQKETRRLSQMVEELLDFSRIESGRLKLQTEVFDLRGELYDALFTYTELLRQEGMASSYEEPEEPIMINGDRDRLKQVFLNIIDNAAKYGKDGKKIAVSAVQENGMAVVRIQDYGMGIPQDELPFVKEKFFKGSAKGRGAGIGLAVCTEIVELHEGTIDIESEYGEGTCVIITLPLYRPEG